MPLSYSGMDIQHIRQRVTVTPTGCWEWDGANKDGYAQIWVPSEKKQVIGHRLVWKMVKGPIPDGMLICHRCDNRKCVNPEHLFQGTYADNNIDCIKKGRRKPIKTSPRTIRAELWATELVKSGKSVIQVALEMGYTRQHVHSLLNNCKKRWATTQKD